MQLQQGTQRFGTALPWCVNVDIYVCIWMQKLLQYLPMGACGWALHAESSRGAGAQMAGNCPHRPGTIPIVGVGLC